uniref:Uncharacterized protein n=1 Tax=Neolamprologus brichardi TaxID=32507 RepID=A0A3Q4HRY8_NEOBR
MMMITFVFVFLFFLAGVWSEIKLEQSPSEVKRPGERVKLSCIISVIFLTTTILLLTYLLFTL